MTGLEKSLKFFRKKPYLLRMGANKVSELYPKLLARVEKEGRKIVWSCDPMHGNVEKASNGYKTRDFANILSEVKQFFHDQLFLLF